MLVFFSWNEFLFSKLSNVLLLLLFRIIKILWLRERWDNAGNERWKKKVLLSLRLLTPYKLKCCLSLLMWHKKNLQADATSQKCDAQYTVFFCAVSKDDHDEWRGSDEAAERSTKQIRQKSKSRGHSVVYIFIRKRRREEQQRKCAHRIRSAHFVWIPWTNNFAT